jgi:YaaC-like Protein
MPAPELRIANRTAYFRKAITTPDFTSERVLARDAFEFAELWLKRECPGALPYWDQARSYYKASKTLPAQSSPLTSYYCFLNAVKSLLLVKGVGFSEHHGVSGRFDPASRRALRNEKITFRGGGLLAALSGHLAEDEQEEEHTLTDVLSNLPFIHRAYRYTFRSHPELFIPLRNVVYRKHPVDDYIWVTAKIEGKFTDRRTLRTLPAAFEIDTGFENECIVRTRRRVRWFDRGSSQAERDRAQHRVATYHRRCRQDLVYISASPDLWYLKRDVAGAKRVSRCTMTLIMAAMHHLSELSRYDPRGLGSYLDGRENWLLTEFIELAPAQFMDELVCEMTSLEVGIPGVRPRST